MWYFLIGIIIIVALILIIPIRVKLKYNIRHRKKSDNNNILDDIISQNDSYPNENYMIVYILYFIPVLKIRLDKKKNSKKSARKKSENKLRKKIIADDVITKILNFLKSIINYEKTNKFYFNTKDAKSLAKHLKYKKLDINFGINFFEPIINSYVIAFLNSIINIYIAKNINQFNLNKTNYTTYISNEIYSLRINMIMSVSIIIILPIIIKALIKYFILKKKINNKLKNNVKQNNKSPQMANNLT